MKKTTKYALFLIAGIVVGWMIAPSVTNLLTWILELVTRFLNQ